ncbi:MAG: MoaD/ThiS family protein [Desulfobacteraceae bacterium]|jgi:molybdopterin converting factor small subunit|nr:MAG: MoaD/ThiS family protein [Desulfobacteraceae bacterium]
MDIELHLYATLAKYLPEDATSKTAMITMASGETVRDLITGLGIPEKTVKLIFINGVHGKKDTVLKDGDRVGLFPPVGGG